MKFGHIELKVNAVVKMEIRNIAVIIFLPFHNDLKSIHDRLYKKLI